MLGEGVLVGELGRAGHRPQVGLDRLEARGQAVGDGEVVHLARVELADREVGEQGDAQHGAGLDRGEVDGLAARVGDHAVDVRAVRRRWSPSGRARRSSSRFHPPRTMKASAALLSLRSASSLSSPRRPRERDLELLAAAAEVLDGRQRLAAEL
jgi:hypothetical protein